MPTILAHTIQSKHVTLRFHIITHDLVDCVHRHFSPIGVLTIQSPRLTHSRTYPTALRIGAYSTGIFKQCLPSRENMRLHITLKHLNRHTLLQRKTPIHRRQTIIMQQRIKRKHKKTHNSAHKHHNHTPKKLHELGSKPATISAIFFCVSSKYVEWFPKGCVKVR